MPIEQDYRGRPAVIFGSGDVLIGLGRDEPEIILEQTARNPVGSTPEVYSTTTDEMTKYVRLRFDRPDSLQVLIEQCQTLYNRMTGTVESF